MTFEDGCDDLDYFKAALIKTSDGKDYALIRYRGCPSPGTEIWIYENSENPESDLNELLNLLGIEQDSLTWIHSDIEDK